MFLQGSEKRGMHRPVIPPPTIRSVLRHLGREWTSRYALQRLQVITSTVDKLDKVVESVPGLANLLCGVVTIDFQVELFDFRCGNSVRRELGDQCLGTRVGLGRRGERYFRFRNEGVERKQWNLGSD